MTYEELREEWESDSPFIVCHTSGSTGKPKEINISKEFIAGSARRTIDFFGINSDSLLYSCISPDFIGGKMMLFRSIIAESSFLWETPSNSPLKNYSGRGISLLSIVPSQMIYLLDHQESLPDIKNILIGGAPIPESLRNRIIHSGLNTFESYGMTETASHIAIRRIEKDQKPFRTLDGITVANADNTLSINIGHRYSFKTNDVAEILSPREFFIKGRIDNVIISGAKKIFPEEIEKKLSPFITVPFFITSLPDNKWGEKIVMIIEGEHDRDNLLSICSEILEPYQKPKEILSFPKLLLTENGKLKRIIPDSGSI